MEDLAFAKILNIREESQKVKYQITYIAIAHVQKALFLQMRRCVPFKRCRTKLLEEIVITIIFKLKALVTCTKLDLGSGDI